MKLIIKLNTMAYQCPKCGYTSEEDVDSCPTCDESTADTEEEDVEGEEDLGDGAEGDLAEKSDTDDLEE